jgi:glycerol-3-phosphate dehydrogenase (NAD(P)+)
MRVGLIGLGNMGTAVGNMVARNGHEVLGWEHQAAVVDEINHQHSNSRYLEGVALDEKLAATGELTAVIEQCGLIFIAIPSVFIGPTLEPVRQAVPAETIFVNMAKGIDRQTGLTSFQTVAKLLPDNRHIMLSGPSVANEFARGLPTVVILGGDDRSDLLQVAQILDNDYFRTRLSDDAVGVELGGVLKNIYAIGLGLFDGQGITSINFRAVYLTLALEEMAHIGVAMGARLETFLYLAGIGDLLATSLSQHSHNRHLGERLAQGAALEAIRAEMGVLPEGYNTLQATLYIAEKLHVAAPLAKGLWDVINGRLQAQQFIAAFIRNFVE